MADGIGDIRENIFEFFKQDGLLASHFENYEFRDSQLQMAYAILDSLEGKSHIFIEAPTGIGKSFAYLVPAIYFAKKYGKKAVISTHTINLQEQIIGKDIPLLKKILPLEFEANLLKGKTNYVCPKRLRKAYDNASSLFEDDGKNVIERLVKWAKTTNDGTLSDINFRVDADVWQTVCAEVNICSNRTCGNPEDTECFYRKAKEKIYSSDVVILNHYLFFSLYNFAPKDKKEGYIFPNDFIIFDEGHTLEDAVAEQMVPSVSREMIRYHLLRLYNDRKRKGFLTTLPALHVLPVVLNLLDINQAFFYEVRRKYFVRTAGKYDSLTVRIRQKLEVSNHLNDEIVKLVKQLAELKSFARSELEENEINDFMVRFAAFNKIINDFISLDNPEYVYWIELSGNAPEANVKLCASPPDISEYMRDNIFKENNTCVLTSATLSIGDNFDYFKSRLGAESAGAVKLPTQFDYYRQVKLYIPNDRDLTPKTDNSPQYINALEHWIKYFLKETGGKALVLFTNSYLMKTIGGRIRNSEEAEGFEILIQGEGDSRRNLLDRFKSDINSVLLGLDSFWLGVDAPGETLSNLIITRLPFVVPDHPLIQARLELIDSKGGNSFAEYSLPEAILKFRQGTGRLIRNKTDEGIIVVLDNRILTKPYGKHFLDSIDECPRIIL
ncbi:MAG: DEAD/DEAH box helicase [Bacteroidetes bacterium]|nr:DEAD/DEAH box helicase [Bacteroidota bacterium]